MSQTPKQEVGKKGEATVSEQPTGKFETSDGLSDLIFIVEDKKLYVHKMVLALNSPVFRLMFSSPNFKEGKASEIPLPGKSYQAIVNFLHQLYPGPHRAPIKDDTLEDMLALADEYQVDFLVDKCRDYLKQQASAAGQSLTVAQTLMYLYMCYKYSHHLSFWGDFLKIAATKGYRQVKTNKFFLQLPDECRMEMVSARCERLESNKQLMTSEISRISQTLKVLPATKHKPYGLHNREHDTNIFCKECSVEDVLKTIGKELSTLLLIP